MKAKINKNYLALSSSLAISKTGDYAHEVVFALIVIELLRENYLLIGVVYFFRFVPFIFFGPIGGWLADRYPLKNTMIYSELLRLVASVSLLFLYEYNALNLVSMIACTLVITVGRSIFQPSFQSCVPKLFRESSLIRINSSFQMIDQIASIAGPLLCSLLIVSVGKQGVLIFDSLTYVVSMAALLMLTQAKAEGSLRPAFSVASIFKETWANVQFLRWHSRDLFASIIGSALCILFTASLLRYVLPAFVIFKGGTEVEVSYIFAALASGTVVGSLLYARFSVIRSPSALMKWWMAYGAVFILLACTINLSISLSYGISFVLGGCGAFVDISIVSLIQALSGKQDIGKNFGLFSTLANTGEAASGLIYGFFALGGVFASFIMMASLISLSAMLMLRNMGRGESPK